MKPKDEAKDQAIKQATLDLVFEKGIAGIKMSEVAKKAAIGTGSLYTYYKDKETLLTKIYEDAERRNAEEIFRGIAPTLPFPVKAKIICFNYIEYLTHYQEEIVFREQYRRSPFCFDPTQSNPDEAQQHLFEMIAKGKASYHLKQVPDVEILLAMEGIIKSIVQYYIESKVPITEEVRERIFSICWDGLKA